jgi:hypothetical protein
MTYTDIQDIKDEYGLEVYLRIIDFMDDTPTSFPLTEESEEENQVVIFICILEMLDLSNL